MQPRKSFDLKWCLLVSFKMIIFLRTFRSDFKVYSQFWKQISSLFLDNKTRGGRLELLKRIVFLSNKKTTRKENLNSYDYGKYFDSKLCVI